MDSIDDFLKYEGVTIIDRPCKIIKTIMTMRKPNTGQESLGLQAYKDRERIPVIINWAIGRGAVVDPKFDEYHLGQFRDESMYRGRLDIRQTTLLTSLGSQDASRCRPATFLTFKSMSVNGENTFAVLPVYSPYNAVLGNYYVVFGPSPVLTKAGPNDFGTVTHVTLELMP